MTGVDVEHFIPFSQYPRDLAHNFVLAHARCNRSKAASPAAKQHLERWLTRILRDRDALAQIGYTAGLAVDLTTSERVAQWGCSKAVSSGASAWRAPGRYESADYSYLALFE